ncbi:MAG: hypothetical protein ATN35_11955 [Epulopiscium sp. Nele67-Bin004]|nr:MAG: hypothetical protein ATN35_11955 [Epulopiscium sp. Nele67-Bin004]
MRNVPKLRFEGFNDEWEERQLGEMGDFHKGNTLCKADLTPYGKPCILYGELYTKYNEVITQIYSNTLNNSDKLFSGQAEDILIPSSGETILEISIASCLKINNVLLGGDINVFRPNNVNGTFLAYQLNNTKKTAIAKLAQGTMVVHLYNSQLKKLLIKTGSSGEQEKIAQFFTLLDKRISLQQEKVSLLREKKRGLMQQIFSRKLRFKDENGEAYPEWEEKKLGEITIKIGSGKTPKGGREVYTTDGIIFLRSQNIYNNRLELNEVAYIDQAINLTMKSTEIQPNDILLNITGASIGRCCSIPLDFPKANVNQHVCIIRLKENYQPIFIVQQIISPNVQLQISKYQAGGNREGLNFEQIKELRVFIPSKQEQQKIADLLSILDRKIEKEDEKLKSLREQKKAFVQQMFV